MSDRDKSTVRVGIIGAGNISNQYLTAVRQFPVLRVQAIADLNVEAARAKANEFGIAKACTVDELLDDPSIQLVLNLTIPAAHVPVGLRALDAGKHVFGEKPLGVNFAEAARFVEIAAEKKLRVGNAPDTFLGAGIQTARAAIDGGMIGRPVAFTALMLSGGHETWHPTPEFYYQPGGGPMLDMGPYYITALMTLLGPVDRVMGMSTISRPTRTITSKPQAGKVIQVQCPDHVVGVMQFANGATGSVIQSFAMPGSDSSASSPIIVYGTSGTLHVPDPNAFDGTVRLCRETNGKPQFTDIPHAFPTGYGRGVGLADMATALVSGRPHRCSAEQALAAMEIMQAFTESSDSGREVRPGRKFDRPSPMNVDVPEQTPQAAR